MAEEAQEQEAGKKEEVQPKKKLSGASVGLLVQSVLMLAMVGMVAKVVFMTPKPDLSKKVLEERVIASIRDTKEEIKHMTLDELVVNIDNDHTIKARFVLELSDQAIQTILDARVPVIKSKILRILSDQRFARIEKIQGKLELKDMLIQILNDELASTHYKGTGTIRDIFFVDFVLI